MRGRLYLAGVLGGIAALIVLGVVVFQFGRFDPSPPSLQDDPDDTIPGQVAYLNGDGCVMRVDASGRGHEQLYCLGTRYGPAWLTWLDGETIGVLDASASMGKPMTSPAGPEYELARLDVRTKTLGPTGELYPAQVLSALGRPLSPTGESAETDEDGAVYVIKDGVRTKVADFDAPRYSGPQVIGWSPDGNWMLLTYYPRRGNGRNELWVVSKDGRTQGTLVTDATGGPSPAWWIEGAGAWPALER